ncbi:DUF975 family protein [Streptococcus catagoni]|uniref:DUF975 family protein n=1 Tax=Streptococcus catagoni TaxID=2654874 RepID=UPI00140A8DC7|nr:DUF975 family protein [Streptococcus catagoni]
MKISSLKKEAKELLKNLKGKYQLFLIPFILQAFQLTLQIRENYLIQEGIQISFLASLFPILMSFILNMFLLSAAFTLLSVIRQKRQEVSFSDSTLTFSRDYFFKLLFIKLVRFLLLLLWSLVLFLGLTLLVIASFAYLSNARAGTSTLLSTLTMIGGFIIALVGACISINRQIAYSLAEYIAYDQIQNNNYLSSLDPIEKSRDLIKGYKWKFFLLQLSFIGWYILVILSFGILYIYLLPYLTTSNLYFYENLKKNKEAASIDAAASTSDSL